MGEGGRVELHYYDARDAPSITFLLPSSSLLSSPPPFPLPPLPLTQQVGITQQAAGQCRHDAGTGAAAKVLPATRELGVDLALQAADAAPQGNLKEVG